MILSTIGKSVLGIAAAAGFAIGAAVSASADDEHLDEVWADAVGNQEPILSDKQFGLLNNLAFQAAATKICGYELNHDDFTTAFVDATTPAPADMTDEEAEEWKTAVVFRLGTVYGVLLTTGNADADSFCANAAEMRDDPEVPHVWQ
ncbi:hypothetical protein [Bauldia sp.]|uniref:hypothetical protein n=1 Tax=Bauldia sp. TaxID=2575872 RepID=UPI003BA9B300